MRLATIKLKGKEVAGLVTPIGVAPLSEINANLGTSWPDTLFELIQAGQVDELKAWSNSQPTSAWSSLAISFDEVDYGPLYRHPRKIWGIGLNYVDHASDLNEKAPSEEPASFMKPDTTIIGPEDTILLPEQSERVTAEAELGIIIGKECRNVSFEDAPSVVAGLTTIIDMTAEDILQRNPRFLTRSKSFDTFFTFGPHMLTLDEVEDINKLEVSTINNGSLHRKNVVSNMTFLPWFLVSFHSKVMTLLPGDIISTGTPGAVVIRDGDIVECQIDGFEPLRNPVRRY
jgi:2-keto-4-pentenoate hydratase/2-oxohepta-3-ene-1,7-dioic acid hydratase in catechol pathway